MATLTKTFVFLSDAEGFMATVNTGITLAYSSTVGNPPGSLEAKTINKNQVALENWWEWTGTWESLGVPAGAIVTSVRLMSASTRCSSRSSHATITQIGPYELRDSASALVGTLWAGRTASAAETAWVATATQTAVAVPSHTSGTTVKIRLADTIATGGGGGSANVAMHDDQLSLEVTYTEPVPVTLITASDTSTPVVIDVVSTKTVTAPNVSISWASLVVPGAASETVQVAASDAFAPGSLIESTSFETVSVTGADSITPSVIDNSAAASYGLAQDILTPNIVDASGPIVISGLIVQTASDTATPLFVDDGVAEVTLSTKSSTEILSPTASDAVVSTIASSAANETLSLIVDESAALDTTGLAQDIVLPVIIESSEIMVSGATTVAAGDTVTSLTVDEALVEVTLFTKSSSETVSPALSDSAADTISYLQVSDLSTPLVLDSAAVYATGLAQDIVLSSIVESVEVTLSGEVTKSAEDSLTPSITDVGPAPGVELTIKQASEGITPVLSESISIGAEVITPDLLVPAFVDVSTLRTSGLAQDLLSPATTETSSVAISGLIIKSGAESLTLALLEISTIQAGAASADILTPTLGETSSFGGAIEIVASDATVLTIVDSAAGIVQNTPLVSHTAGDVLLPSVTESVSTHTTGLGSDLVVPSIVETVTVEMTGTFAKVASDILLPGLTDLIALNLSYSASDSIIPAVIDQGSASELLGFIDVDTTDTLRARVTEKTGTYPDSFSPGEFYPGDAYLDEGVYPGSALYPQAPITLVETITKVSSDSARPVLTDAGLLDVTLTIKSGSDAIRPNLLEGGPSYPGNIYPGEFWPGGTGGQVYIVGQPIGADSIASVTSDHATVTVVLSSSDIVLSTLTENSVRGFTLVRPDNLTATVTEARTIFVSRLSSDSMRPLISDESLLSQGQGTIEFSSSDSVTVKIVDFSSVELPKPKKIKIWNGSTWIQGNVKVWRTSGWHEPTIKIYNGAEWI